MNSAVEILANPRWARAQRAIQGLAQGKLRVSVFVVGRLWVVQSTMSGRSQEYMVGRNVVKGSEWSCTCPDFQKREQECKHIMAVKLLIEQHI